jgi:ferrochelatase
LAPEVPLRILFSAHGLPQTIVTRGDPYQYQVERTVGAVVRSMAVEGLDWSVCYQSRATPQKWLEPSTEQAIDKAAADKTAVLVVPIAFVSEHSETLVELDIEYRKLAEEVGVVCYLRAPAVAAAADFISGLARLVQQADVRPAGIASGCGERLCPQSFTACPMQQGNPK